MGLPEDYSEIKRLISDGWTQGQIADYYGVTAQAVSKRLKKEGQPNQRVSYETHPWSGVREEHRQDMARRHLLNYGRTLAGQDVAPHLAAAMNNFFADLDARGVAVHYTPERGYHPVARRNGVDGYWRKTDDQIQSDPNAWKAYRAWRRKNP